MYMDELGFDIEKARNCAEIYSISTGIGTLVIDIAGNTVFNTNGKKNACSFCKRLNCSDNKRQSCYAKYLLYGSYQAERFGGKYIFFCPLGLTHWASPIVNDGVMKGAVLGGPVLMIEPEEFLIDDFLVRNKIDESNLEILKKYIYETPVVKTERVNSLAEMLFLVAADISDIKPSTYLEEIEFQKQQAGISEYIHHIKTMGGDDSLASSYPLEKEKELLSLISLGDKPGSQRVLNEIFGHIFFSSGVNFETIKARVLELVVLLSRAALEGGADIEQIFGLNYNYLSEIHNFKTVEELTFWLSKIMARFTDCVFDLTDVKHLDIIYKAIDFVKRNYMKKITLEEVASQVYLSPSYFSKIFKDEMKYNFNSYLNRVRIKMSRKILLNESVPLVDVPNMVGYEDQSYFSKVFKKMTGLSPGKYRETRGAVKI